MMFPGVRALSPTTRPLTATADSGRGTLIGSCTRRHTVRSPRTRLAQVRSGQWTWTTCVGIVGASIRGILRLRPEGKTTGEGLREEGPGKRHARRVIPTTAETRPSKRRAWANLSGEGGAKPVVERGRGSTMNMLPPDSGLDNLNEAIRRMNRNNGQIPIIGQKPRMSGWVCPKCGTEALQAVENAGTPTQPVPRYLTDDNGGPLPFSVAAAEITGENEDGTPVIYKTTHCLECFNKWQRRKMMEEIRANVPQLVRKSDAS